MLQLEKYEVKDFPKISMLLSSKFSKLTLIIKLKNGSIWDLKKNFHNPTHTHIFIYLSPIRRA